MKVLLINTSFDHESKYNYIAEPLGMLYLLSHVNKYKQNGFEIDILDSISEGGIRHIGNKFLFGLTTDEILSKINIYKPDVIGIGSLFSLRQKDLFHLAKEIKRKYPQIKVIGGGIHPTLFPKETLEQPSIDYVVIGEGEKSFLLLLRYINGDKTINIFDIDGIGYKQDGNIFINPKVSFIENLDDIPFPARTNINYNFYLNYKMALLGLGTKKAASIITSRSCPQRCSFCSMHLSHGPKWRPRSAENVVEEIVDLKSKFHIDELYIMDDNFTFDKERTLEICNMLKRLKLDIRWNTPNGIAAKTLDKEVLISMKESGCSRIIIGVETGDEYLRNKVIGKHLKNEKIEEVVEIANKIGLPIYGFYVIGMIGETEESFQMTLSQVKNLRFSGIFVSFATPLPGTRLYKQCVEKGYIDSKYDFNQKFNVPTIKTEIFSLKDVEMREQRLYRAFLKSHFFQLIKDALLKRNDLLRYFFIRRILYEKIFKYIR